MQLAGIRSSLRIPPSYQLLNFWKLVERNFMKIDFAYVNPGGNPTVLVLTPVKRAEQVKIAKGIMGKVPTCEQVGFIERAANPKAELRLQMMGGEFCGNALRAVAAWLVDSKEKVLPKDTYKFLIETSGTDKLISISAKVNSANKVTFAQAEVPITQNKSVLAKTIYINGKRVPAYLVNLEGISFLLLSEVYYKNYTNFKALFSKLYSQKIFKSDAAGLIYYKQLKNYNFLIKPIVYVKKTKTIVKETSCASGSMALMVGKNIKNVKILQPSGCYLNLKIKMDANEVSIGGEVTKVTFETINL